MENFMVNYYYKGDSYAYHPDSRYSDTNYTLYDPDSYSITINTAGHTLTLSKNGAPYKSYPVAVGKRSTPTPKGNFRITNKLMNPGGPFGVRWLGMNIPRGGYGIHGTNNPRSIGKSVSHGCVRMYNKDVTELYSLVPTGTPVTIL
jgi:lipoprotein-anchoring transpeptidase ErfK/SrfK